MMASYILGRVCTEIKSADISGFLDKINRQGIVIETLTYVDMLTIRLYVSAADLHNLQTVAGKCSASLKIVNTQGLYWTLRKILSRPVLIIGIAVLFLLVNWLPTKVLFVSVAGNESLPDQLIIEKANECGIVFGASRREVRSEKMKNSLLAAIPSLQWAGINTSGCTAIISVKERREETDNIQKYSVSSIVASRDGIIESCTALKGNLQCAVGQSVAKGDVLISGYTDLGLCVKATSADGEIFAKTKHDFTVLAPVDYQKKSENISVLKKYGMLIGKKRIFFNKCSGISGAGCDKIYKEYFVTLPGGFELPIGFFVNITTAYESSAVLTAADDPQIIAQNTAQQYLLAQMVSGKILHENTLAMYHNGICELVCRYVCSEMIGRLQDEEIYNKHGENN